MATYTGLLMHRLSLTQLGLEEAQVECCEDT